MCIRFASLTHFLIPARRYLLLSAEGILFCMMLKEGRIGVGGGGREILVGVTSRVPGEASESFRVMRGRLLRAGLRVHLLKHVSVSPGTQRHCNQILRFLLGNTTPSS